MNQNMSELKITVSQADQLITTQMVTKYGPVSFSYSPSEIELGISSLVRDMLQPIDSRSGLPELVISESIRRSAEIYHQEQSKRFPADAIEQFSETARGYSRGTLEQFIDNFPAAISLMMDYLAIAALTIGRTNEGPQANLTIEEKRQALGKILREHFQQAS
jgi:hypothetical protein